MHGMWFDCEAYKLFWAFWVHERLPEDGACTASSLVAAVSIAVVLMSPGQMLIWEWFQVM
jgi:hypothetical protein